MRGVTTAQRINLVGIYLPYLVMPLLILWRAAARPTLFAATEAAGGRSGASSGGARRNKAQ